MSNGPSKRKLTDDELRQEIFLISKEGQPEGVGFFAKDLRGKYSTNHADICRPGIGDIVRLLDRMSEGDDALLVKTQESGGLAKYARKVSLPIEADPSSPSSEMVGAEGSLVHEKKNDEKSSQKKPVVPSNFDVPRQPPTDDKKPDWLRGTRLRQDIFELQGSYGFPRDKMIRPSNLDDMTYEQGEEWMKQAIQIKADNLADMDRKLAERIDKLLPEALRVVMQGFEERTKTLDQGIATMKVVNSALENRITALETPPRPKIAKTVFGWAWQSALVFAIGILIVWTILNHQAIGRFLLPDKENVAKPAVPKQKSDLQRALDEYDDLTQKAKEDQK